MFPPSHRGHRAAFSLVEMLVVLVIVVLLISVTLGLFRYMAPKRLEGASSVVRNSLVLAKETAVLKRVPVMMVIPTEGKLALRGVALYEQTAHGDQWKPLTGWRALPETIVFDSSAPGSPFTTPVALPDGFPASLKLAGQTVGAAELCGVLFDPQGRSVHHPLLRLRLRSEANHRTVSGGVELQMPELMREVELRYP